MSLQQSLLSDHQINIEKLNEIMNRIVFPDTIHILKKMVAQIPSEDSKFFYANDLKEKFEKIEEQSRNGKNFISSIRTGEGENKTIGCSESGYFRFQNPVDGKPDSIQVIIYKKPIKLDIEGFEERRFCSQFNANTHENKISIPSLIVKNLASAIGGIVRDNSLTDQFSQVRADERLEKYNNEKNIKIKKPIKIPEIS